jgi:hypothetical protein
MKRILLATSLLTLVASSGLATAGTLNVSGVLSWTPDGANFDYQVKLTNLASSTDSIQTFWYAWVPGEDYLSTPPTSVTPPSGWNFQVTHFPDVSTNGYAIQYTTTTDALAPGDSLIFRFTSPDTPAMLTGNSAFFDHPPIGTAFVYSGQPFQGDSLQFTVSSVPEPSSLLLGLLALPMVAMPSLWKLRRSSGR